MNFSELRQASYMLCGSQNGLFESLQASYMLCRSENGPPSLYKPHTHFVVVKTDSPNFYKVVKRDSPSFYEFHTRFAAVKTDYL